MSNKTHSIRWAFNIADWKPVKEQWKLCLQCVPPEEKERCHRFCFVEDCKSSMVAQLLMRKAVNESLDIPYDKISFARTSSGKPYLITNKENSLYFNISHNGDFCVLASEKDINVGVDIMKIEHRGKRSVSNFFELMQKQFSFSEWDFITSPGFEREQLERFFRLWSLKESYVKATGIGIAYDLQSLSFSCSTPVLKCNTVTCDTKLFLNESYLKDWIFEETMLDNNHCLVVALGPSNQNEENISRTLENHRPINFVTLTFDELMRNCIPFETADEQLWENFSSKSEKRNV